MTSTASSPNNSLTEETPPTNPENPSESQPPRTPEQELQRGLRLREGIKRLLRMRAMKSISDGMDWEKEAIDTQTKLDEEVIRGETATSNATTTDAEAVDAETDMQEWVAGDKTTIVHNHAAPVGKTAAAPATETKSAGWLPTAAIAAATLVGGAGLGYLANEAMKPDATPTQNFEDTDTKTDVVFPP